MNDHVVLCDIREPSLKLVSWFSLLDYTTWLQCFCCEKWQCPWIYLHLYDCQLTVVCGVIIICACTWLCKWQLWGLSLFGTNVDKSLQAARGCQ